MGCPARGLTRVFLLLLLPLLLSCYHSYRCLSARELRPKSLWPRPSSVSNFPETTTRSPEAEEKSNLAVMNSSLEKKMETIIS